jgi:hypothetical protein
MMRTNPTKLNPWTIGLAAAGIVSLASVVQAEEAQSQVLTALSSTTLSGYVDTSAIWHLGKGNGLVARAFDQGSAQGATPTAAGFNKQDGFNLNAVKLTLEKPLDDGQWAAGYHVGLMFGPDANALASNSAFTPSSDFAIKDAYVTLRAPVGNGLEFKVGLWTELLGYEVTESLNNPNYSRSWGFFLEPILHTGVLASYKFNDSVSLSGGVVDNGVASNAINSRPALESKKSYTGMLTLTAPESFGFLKGATVSLTVLDSGIAGGKNPINYYAGGTIPTPIEGLTVGVAYDYRANGAFNSSYENAIGGYLIYQATEKLKFASRTEYATGSPGTWGITPALNAAGTEWQNVRLLGETFTIDYALWANVITRAELRWDHSLSGQRMFLTGNARNSLSLALNVIYKF